MSPTKKLKKLLWIIPAVLVLLVLLLLTIFLVYFFSTRQANGEIISGGEKRSYLIYVPASYTGKEALPLVFTFHGYAGWPAQQKRTSHWDQLAEEKGFIVVYPMGTDTPLHWRTGGDPAQLQDVQFISDLIDHLQKEYNIDAERIYANGLSNGGGMSFLLSCKLSDRIAAFGGVSGAYLLPWERCEPERPLPAIIFHGTADEIVPFEGGPSRAFDVPFPLIRDWVAELAQRNGCSTIPQALPDQGEVSAVQYTDCEQNADVIFYTIAGGGHAWPGGDTMPRAIVGHTTRDIDATRLIWAFFEEHPMPQE